MRPEINDADIELLFKALKAYEEEPSLSGMNISMMTTMMGLNGRTEEEREAAILAKMNKSKGEARKREEEGVMLKAKLLRLRNWLAEHQLEEDHG